MKLFLRNNTWWVSHGTGGKRIRQSTGKTDRDEAERVAREICAPAMLRDEADIVKVAGDIASGKRRNAAAMERRARRLDECLALFPLVHQDGSPVHPRAVGMDALAWRRLVAFCHDRGVDYVADVTGLLANQFLASLSYGTKLSSYCYCRARFRRMGVEDNPFSVRPSIPATARRHREPLSDDDVRRVLEYLESPVYQKFCHDAREFALYFRFLLYTGLRMGDAATARHEQCDFETRVIRRTMQKTGRTVEFPMHRALAEALPKHGEGWLFPGMAALYLHHQPAISKRFNRLFKRLGMRRGRGEVCTHSIRSTFATICCEAGVPIAVIQSWLGHSSQTVTRIYAHFYDMEKKREAIEKFPEF